MQVLIDVAVRDQFIERYGKNAVTEVTPRNYLATIELPENPFSYQFLAGFGDKIKIIKPESFIANYKFFLEEALKLYQ